MDSKADLFGNLKKVIQGQASVFCDLTEKCYDKIMNTCKTIQDLLKQTKEEHHFYHCNIWEMKNLGSKIDELMKKSEDEIKRCKEDLEERKKHFKELIAKEVQKILSQVHLTQSQIEKHLQNVKAAVDQAVEGLISANFWKDILTKALSFLSVQLIVAGLANSGIVSSGIVGGPLSLGIGFGVAAISSEILFYETLDTLINQLDTKQIELGQEKKNSLTRISSGWKETSILLIKDLTNIHTTNNTQIVWLDRADNKANDFFLTSLTSRFPNNQPIRFTDEEPLMKFMNETINNMILVTSGQAGEYFCPKLDSNCKIKGIIVYCWDVQKHQKWSKQYPSIVGVFNLQDEVFLAIDDLLFSKRIIGAFSIEEFNLHFHTLHPPEYYFQVGWEQFHINTEDHYLEAISKAYHYIKDNEITVSRESYNKRAAIVEKIFKSLTAQDFKGILRLYTEEDTPFYHLVNDALLTFNEKLIILLEDFLQALRYSLFCYDDEKGSPSAKITLWRGLRDAKKMKQFKIGDVIIFPAFTSTSTSKEVSTSFAGEDGIWLKIEVEISTDLGKKYRPKCIEKISKWKAENEYLFNAFSMFRVDDISADGKMYTLFWISP